MLQLTEYTNKTNEMNTELTTEIAGQVQHWHLEAQSHAGKSKEHAIQALEAGVNAGNYLVQAKAELTKGETLSWLRDNVPDLTQQQAKAYMSLYHVAQKHRDSSGCIDHRQLTMLGIIDQKEAVATPKQGAEIGTSKWIGWVGNICGWFNKTTADKPVSSWPKEERRIIKSQLEPLVAIYNAL